MPWRGIGFVPVPYHRTIKAVSYAGRSLVHLRKVLEYAMLEYPRDQDDNVIKRVALTHKSQARKTKPNFVFTDEECVDLEIDTMYHYIMADGKRGVSEKADFVCKILIDCRDLMLRQMVDTLLFIGEFDPNIIAEKIYTNTITPTTRWGAQEIGFYRDYFWDASVMSNCDWQHYRSWFRNEQPKLNHVQYFNPSMDRAELLLRARLNSGVSDMAMLAHTKDMLYWMLTKANKGNAPEMVARLTTVLNKTITTSAKDLGDTDSRRKFESAIDRITTPLDGSVGAVRLVSRDELPKDSEIGDRAKSDQLESVLDGSYDVKHVDDQEERDYNVIRP